MFRVQRHLPMTHPAKMHSETAAELREELEDFEGEDESDLEENSK